MYNLLIVDDIENSRIGLSRLDWESLNIKVAALVCDGYEALEYIQKYGNIHIVLSDIKMPKMDGIELSEKIHKFFPDIITVILSGYNDFNYVKSCFKNHVFDYLLKPINPDEWAITFKNAVEVLDSSSSADIHKLGNSKKQITTAAIEYIDKHYAQPLTLSVIAENIHISPNYLSKILKEELNAGLPDLLNKTRVENAKKLLSNPRYRVNEIANMVGYNSQQYFTNIFKKYTGLTPYDFRNK